MQHMRGHTRACWCACTGGSAHHGHCPCARARACISGRRRRFGQLLAQLVILLLQRRVDGVQGGHLAFKLLEPAHAQGASGQQACALIRPSASAPQLLRVRRDARAAAACSGGLTCLPSRCCCCWALPVVMPRSCPQPSRWGAGGQLRAPGQVHDAAAAPAWCCCSCVGACAGCKGCVQRSREWFNGERVVSLRVQFRHNHRLCCHRNTERHEQQPGAPRMSARVLAGPS